MSVTDKLNEEIKSASGEISEQEAIKIFKTYAKGIKETISIARDNNKEDAAMEAEKELEIVNEFLPEELPPEEIEKVVARIIAENEISSMSGMGQVMSKAMSELQDKADGAIVKDIAIKLLKEQ